MLTLIHKSTLKRFAGLSILGLARLVVNTSTVESYRQGTAIPRNAPLVGDLRPFRWQMLPIS
jgi:hypothetical protein